MSNVIVECMFGSHLYGTNSEDSDTDMAMVFLPSKRDILLGNVFYSDHSSTKKGADTNV